MRKIGLSIRSNIDFDYWKPYLGILDFFEYSTNASGMSPDILSSSEIPVGTIHSGHFEGTGANPVDPKLQDFNIKELKHCIELANYFGATTIIVHPERRTNPLCSIENLIQVLKISYDPRLAIENMPEAPGVQKFFCREALDIKNVMQKANVGMCLDVGHAAIYAARMGLDYIEYIEGLVQLHPRHCHLHDNFSLAGNIGDHHMEIGEGSLPWEQIISLLPEDITCTMETGMDVESNLRSIQRLRKMGL